MKSLGESSRGITPGFQKPFLPEGPSTSSNKGKTQTRNKEKTQTRLTYSARQYKFGLSLWKQVFQDVTLFDDTVTENIRMGRLGATDEEVRAAARAAHCEEFFIRRLPQG